MKLSPSNPIINFQRLSIKPLIELEIKLNEVIKTLETRKHITKGKVVLVNSNAGFSIYFKFTPTKSKAEVLDKLLNHIAIYPGPYYYDACMGKFANIIVKTFDNPEEVYKQALDGNSQTVTDIIDNFVSDINNQIINILKQAK